MKQNSEKENVILKILNVLIIITSIPLIIITILLGNAIIDKLDSGYDETSLHYEFMRSNYLRILEDYSRNIKYNNNKEETAKTKEYYSVGKYYESTSLYKAYLEYGNLDLANFYKEKMNEYEKGMGQLSASKKEILEKLELNEE